MARQSYLTKFPVLLLEESVLSPLNCRIKKNQQMNSQKKKNLKVSIPPDILKELKKPLGKLILDSDITEKKIRKEIMNNSHKIIAVGDHSTDKLISFEIFP